MLKWLFLIIVLVVLFIILIKFKHPRIEILNIISGGLGCGKTSSMVSRTINLLRKYYFLWRNKNIKNDYIIISNFPIGRLDKKSNKRYIKIWFKKIYCYDLDLDILTMQERLNQNEVILLIDEFSSIANQFDFGNPIIKNNIDEFISKFRHYTNSKGYIFAADQCSQNIFLQVRRRSNYVYNMLKLTKIRFFPICIYQYRKIYISDEVNNFIEIQDANKESDIIHWVSFTNPFKYYNSCYLSNRYLAITKLYLPYNKNVNSLYRNDLMKLTEKKKLYYECLKFDNITIENYEKN